MMNKIEIFTDGSCRGNQSDHNSGGYGAVLLYKENKKEIYGGEANTTNNIMELKAMIEALKALKRYDMDVVIYSDSAYIINCFKEKWYVKWEKNAWQTSAKKCVENIDEWKELLSLVRKCKQVSFHKVKGHLKADSKDFKKWYKKFCDTEYKISMEGYNRLISYNNLADELANRGADEYDIK